MFLGGARISSARPAMDWWIEVVGQRSVPEAVQESRRKAADKAAEKADKGLKKDEELGDKLKDKVKALLDILPKLKLEEGEGENAKAPAGGKKPAVEEKEAEGAAVEEPDKVPTDKEGVHGQEENRDAGNETEGDKLSITVAMAGEILALRNDHLVFRPALQPDKQLKLPLSKVSSLSRHGTGEKMQGGESDALGFRVSLRDGSEIPGKLVKLTDDVIVVALAGSGTELSLPLAEITRVERSEPISEAAKGILPEVPGRHVASLSTGEIVAGQLLPSRDSDRWLRISSPILTVEAPLSLIDLLVFPDPEAVVVDVEELLAEEIEVEEDGNNGVPSPTVAAVDADPGEFDEPEAVVRHLVSLAPAGMLWAKKIEVDGSDLLLSALGEERVVVPLDRVESLSFGHEGLPASAPVLVWGGYADEDDEYRKTIDAIDDRIPARKLIRNRSRVPDRDFLRHLRRARVLLIPEMETFKKSALKDAMEKDGRGVPSWSEAFRDFLRRGGNIVFLSPTGESLSFFNECGLGPLRSGGSGTGWEFTEEGRKLGAKVDGVVANVNSTHYYRKAAPWEIWGAAKGGGTGAVVMGRRMERGWVMVYGADFYTTTNDSTETLVRLIQYRSGR
ncbi:MAG: hypothetical protein GY899_10970 [Verrucomicrobiaceae bacterium]|nr:hypothetical protein [Verrucomicrobiaceae bacterium]